MKRHRVAVIGDANTDLLVRIPPDGSNAEPPVMTAGGSGANTAVALAKLGSDAAFIGTVGSDTFGDFVTKDLLVHGIDVTGLRTGTGLNTICAVAVIRPDGERQLATIWALGPPAFKTLDPSVASNEMIQKADWIHTNGMVLPSDGDTIPTIGKIFREAQARGAVTSIDLNLRQEGHVTPDHLDRLDTHILEHSSVVLGSGPEEFALLGGDDWMRNARSLVRPGRAVIARDGSAGATYMSDDATVVATTADVGVVDTVGAGDAFNAGLITGLLRTGSIKVSMRWAAAVAAVCVSGAGARNTPDTRELSTFLARHPEITAQQIDGIPPPEDSRPLTTKG